MYRYIVTWSDLFRESQIPDTYRGKKGIYLIEGKHILYAKRERKIIYIGQSKTDIVTEAKLKYNDILSHLKREDLRYRFGIIKVVMVPPSRKSKSLIDADIDRVEGVQICYHAPAHNTQFSP